MKKPSCKHSANVLGDAWSQLTSEQRRVCVWRKAGFSNVEIARHLGCSPDSVDDMFNRALAALRCAKELRGRMG
jgi:DNA-binding CsgD family transcriptional regulator